MVSAFSIGTSKRSTDQKQNAFVPGPGAYNPEKKQKYQPPSYKIGTSSRSNLLRSFAPGPGAYEHPGKVTKEGPRFSFGIKKPSETVKMFSPGPGAYNPNDRKMVKATPMYSMGARLAQSQMIEAGKVPGPGQYESKSTVLGVPSMRFPHAQRDGFYDLNRTPGPGSYMGKRPSSAGPRYGFGTGNRDSIENLHGGKFPGPGNYESQSLFGDQKRGFSMVSRKQTGGFVEQSRVPGPGSYNWEKKQKYQPPSFKIGSETRASLSKESVRNPGPGSYDAHYEFGRPRSAQVRIGSGQRRGLNDSQSGHQPGPGAYEIQSRVGEGPKIQILGNKFDPVQRQKDFMPGPGQYNPTVEQVKLRPSSAKIGTGNRQDFLGSKESPGVGNYNIRNGPDGPQWGFGSGQRPPLSQPTQTPGPGGYTLKPTFADVPKYLMNNVPRSQQY